MPVQRCMIQRPLKRNRATSPLHSPLFRSKGASSTLSFPLRKNGIMLNPFTQSNTCPDSLSSSRRFSKNMSFGIVSCSIYFPIIQSLEQLLSTLSHFGRIAICTQDLRISSFLSNYARFSAMSESACRKTWGGHNHSDVRSTIKTER